MKILLTGATGHLGTHITELAIKARIKDFNIGVRNLEKVPTHWKDNVSIRQLDYFDVESMTQAFEHIDLVIFIPSIIHPSFKRLPEVENLVQAAQKAQVKQIFYIGFMQTSTIIHSI